jgi:hypothetical protein
VNQNVLAKHEARSWIPALVNMVRETYVLYLATDEIDPAYQQMIARCRDAAGALHEQCFQREGTHHITLAELTLSSGEAGAIKFQQPTQPALPFCINFDQFKAPCPKCVALSPDDESVKDIRAVYGRLYSEYDFPDRRRPALKDAHLSLYRMRGAKNVSEPFKRIKEACANTDLGSVQAIALRIKVKGPQVSYDEYVEMRVGTVSRRGLPMAAGAFPR